jgi:predicted AlkP superfamily pyrophosphatase or phosphodiesterase
VNTADHHEFSNRFQKLLNEYDSRNGSSQEPSQRLVLMVVDALRDDFLDRTDNWPFVSGELKANRACRLTVTVETPTVTMPRIKVLQKY